MMEQTNQSRRKFVKKMAYIPPAIVTLTVLPAFHANGSGWEQGSEQGNSGRVRQDYVRHNNINNGRRPR